MSLSSSVPGVIFDGDDTLWHTQHFYDTAKEKFLVRLEQSGFSRQEASELFDGLDLANVSVMGFSSKRFPLSMVMTYRSLCSAHGLKPSIRTERELRTIGSSVFSRKPTLAEGAEEVLRALRTRYHLILLTKGDREVQEQKIKLLQLRSMVDDIYIVDVKDDESLKFVIADQGLDRNQSLAVGNSLRSDIIPAIKAGLKAIWIATPTWSWEDHGQAIPPGVQIVTNINEIPSLLLGG